MSHSVPRIAFPEGIPTFGGSMGKYETIPGHLPVQQLNNDFDVFWVLSGEAHWKFKDGSEIRASKDQFMVMPPFVPAWISESRAPMVFWYCHFTFRPLPQHAIGRRHADYAGPGSKAPLPMSFTKKDAPRVWGAYRDLSRLKLEPANESWQFERGIIRLVAELARFAQTRKSGRAEEKNFAVAPLDNRVAEIRRRIDEDPTFSWMVSDLAQSAGISPGHLHALCQRVLGKSIKRYIVEARLRHAMKLLKEKPEGEPRSVYDVSEACGFSSQHFFSRQFKAYFNMTPLAFRNGSTLT